MQQATAAGRYGPGSPTTHSENGARFRAGPDRFLRASAAALTGGVSPVTLASAFGDWARHLARSPGRQAELAGRALGGFTHYANYCGRAWLDPHAADGFPRDTRFSGPLWETWPYNVLCRGFLTAERWWRDAASDVPGVSRHHEQIVSFLVRQWLDMVSPASLPAVNPEVLKETVASAGGNLVCGAAHFIDDWRRATGAAPVNSDYELGRNLAATPGKVIFRNGLMELIQYAPATKQVYPEPVLIIPAWLMKYYILDLAPEKSLAEYLVGKGHTVLMVSWKNPGTEDRDLGLEDYRLDGIMAALDAVRAIVPGQRVHGAGYCLGGTLLAAAAALMAREGDDRLKSLTLFAAQTDFTERGELMLFIDEAQAGMLEDMMALEGYLDFKRLTGALRLWRMQDFVWSGLVRNYLLGDRPPMSEYVAWTLDATRLPARAHSEYLRKLVLGNDLAQGRYQAEGHPVSLQDIRIPVFTVSTEADHIAPWRSIYGTHAQTEAPVTFVLAAGGHNDGIVNSPVHPHGYFRVAGDDEFIAHPDPDDWQAQASRHKGSWWPFWQDWLSKGSGPKAAPPGMGAPEQGLTPLCDAPGHYVVMP